MHQEGIVFKDKRYQEIFGLLLILFSVIVFLSLLSFHETDYSSLTRNNPVQNMIGPIGALLAHLLRSAFGLSSFIFVLLFSLSGWAVMKNVGLKNPSQTFPVSIQWPGVSINVRMPLISTRDMNEVRKYTHSTMKWVF